MVKFYKVLQNIVKNKKFFFYLSYAIIFLGIWKEKKSKLKKIKTFKNFLNYLKKMNVNLLKDFVLRYL